MRKISVQGDMILLNNRVYYQRLILDQGYWKESLLTPPSDEAIRKDIEYTKRMGFNGARKHQKIEDPRYYYWADKLGLLVWGEVPSAYDFNDEEVDNLLYETKEFIKRDYNHPCIVTWVPLNESWGVRNIYSDQRQQEFAIALYFTIRSLDQTRLISTNDGWEQIYGDICAVHDYMASGEGFLVKYEDRDAILSKSAGSRMIYCEGEEYDGQPVLITEYGGIAMETEEEGWGYNGKVKDEKEFLRRYESITKAIMNTPYIRGYCYTQLTDVFQEINGLLTMDRRFKVNPEEIRRINQNR
jgi:beta-galactosidase/beta-glucuronidase